MKGEGVSAEWRGKWGGEPAPTREASEFPSLH